VCKKAAHNADFCGDLHLVLDKKSEIDKQEKSKQERNYTSLKPRSKEKKTQAWVAQDDCEIAVDDILNNQNMDEYFDNIEQLIWEYYNQNGLEEIDFSDLEEQEFEQEF
jgi:hypothetical protein